MLKKVSQPYSIRPRIFATPVAPFIDLGFYVPREPGPARPGPARDHVHGTGTGTGTGGDGRCPESLEALPAPTHTHTHTQNSYPALRGENLARTGPGSHHSD